MSVDGGEAGKGLACDVCVVGCGAAGLFAAISCGRALRAQGRRARIVGVDGAKSLGAKVLVAGGGRCNVTHDVVTEADYAGSSSTAIRAILSRFGVEATIAFFAAEGVTLKREATGKLFPTTDKARTVLDALLRACTSAGVTLVHPWRCTAIERAADCAGEGFLVKGTGSTHLHARRVILATGGMALPKSGSDGAGYSVARALGHSITPRVVPALVPMLLPQGHPLTALSGLATPARLVVAMPGSIDKPLASFVGDVLLTHFGISGPCVLDVSRHWTIERERGAGLFAQWVPTMDARQADAALIALSRSASGARSLRSWLGSLGLPDRLAIALLTSAGVPEGAGATGLSRDLRSALVAALCEMPLPVTGDRGFTYAEATAGGVPLAEVKTVTMESRVCPGLFLCGEILDVDGRVGGYNFQFAWASGFLAGRGVAAGIETDAGATTPSAQGEPAPGVS